jgi:hypothetical protein
MPGPREALSAALDCWNAGDLDGYRPRLRKTA